MKLSAWIPVAALLFVCLPAEASVHFVVRGSGKISFDQGNLKASRNSIFAMPAPAKEGEVASDEVSLYWDGSSLKRKLAAVDVLDENQFVFSFVGSKLKANGQVFSTSDLLLYDKSTNTISDFWNMPDVSRQIHIESVDLPNGDASEVLFTVSGTKKIGMQKFYDHQIIRWTAEDGYKVAFDAKANGGPSNLDSFMIDGEDIVVSGRGWKGHSMKQLYRYVGSGQWEPYENIAGRVDGRSPSISYASLSNPLVTGEAASPEPVTLASLALGSFVLLRRKR